MEKKKKQNLFAKSKNEAQGITLIALVITIIVLLILAAVSIATLTGDNGILTKAQTASEKTKQETEKEQIKIAYSTVVTDKMEKGEKGEKGVTAGELEIELQKLEPKATAVEGAEEGKIEVTFPSGNKYTIDSNGKITGPTNEGSGGSTSQGVAPEVKVTVEKTGDNKSIIKVEVTNEVETVDSITVTNLDTGDTPVEVTVNGKTGSVQVEKNGTYKIEVKATTEGVQKTGETTIVVNVIPVTFTTEQGKIDVIWVNKANQKIDAPLVPDTLPSGMKKVYWEEDGTEKKEGEAGFIESNWYDYVAGDNKNDTKTSKWANAINTIEGVESYFVWIPRYAYRITYLTTDGQVAGYCDGDGIRDLAGNKQPATQNVKEDKGIETVEYNGFKYIVHPAFEGNVKNGGWDSDLEGIWVGKYESARSTATENSAESGTTAIQIAPTVKSWVDIDIGTMYTNALNYDTTKDSHLMKNSEWGAVSYLTHSQYGRNGNEVSINRCSDYITGMGRGTSTTAYKYSEAEENQMYNGEFGQLSSSTGNIYGTYDLSGGAREYVAAFNDKVDDNDYETKYGNSFAAPTNPSTKYATKYLSKDDDSGPPTYERYYPGDAIYEVNTGLTTAWFRDLSFFIQLNNPFFFRGGNCNDNKMCRCVLCNLRRWKRLQQYFIPCDFTRCVENCKYF